MRQSITVLFIAFICACAEKKEEIAADAKGPVTHINGNVHDPCTTCQKKDAGDAVKTKDILFFQPIGTNDFYLCLNPELFDHVATPSVKAETSLIKIKVDKMSYALDIAYDLCKTNKCNHKHPQLSKKVSFSSSSFPTTYEGIIWNKFNNDDIYTDDSTFGLLQADSSANTESILFLNTNHISLVEGKMVQYKIAELTIKKGGKPISFELAFDVVYPNTPKANAD